MMLLPKNYLYLFLFFSFIYFFTQRLAMLLKGNVEKN